MKKHDVLLEFSRTLDVARVSKLGSVEKLKADAGECAALARRLKVPTILGLTAELHAKPWRGGGLKVTGHVTVDVEQISVVSLEQFRQTLRFQVERYFSNSLPQVVNDEEEIDPISNGFIDLGEIVAETVGLELDLYPRKSGEEFGEMEIEAVKVPNPFAALKIVK